jgi:uncharacterized protein (DUF2147 family)
MLKKTLLVGLLVLAPVSALAADPVVGIWQTEPDRKNLTSHIQISPCGEKFCGKVLKAFDPSGKEVMTKNIGKQIFWDAEAKGNGKYEKVMIWVPLLNIDAKGEMTLSGNTLKVSGNEGLISGSQVWTRIK